jgi:Domain of unknown function (DUF5666)
MNPSRFSRSVLFLVTLALASSCKDSNTSPTSPNASATAMLTGTVISGTSTLGKRTLGVEIGLGGVTVSVPATGRSTVTDPSGNFTLMVPTGVVQLAFDRADLHARGTVNVTGAATTVTISIAGANAVPVAGGHAGEEIEGLVQAVGGSSLTVLDQRLGAVVVQADGTTMIRRGDATIPLSQIQVGMRVHVKALLQTAGTYLATEILLQDTNVGGNREVSGTVQSVDSTAKTFVVLSGGVPITVRTDSSTMFKRHGGSAAFSDLSAGNSVDVNGILQADGSVLAKKVTIEG